MHVKHAIPDEGPESVCLQDGDEMHIRFKPPSDVRQAREPALLGYALSILTISETLYGFAITLTSGRSILVSL